MTVTSSARAGPVQSLAQLLRSSCAAQGERGMRSSCSRGFSYSGWEGQHRREQTYVCPGKEEK